MSYYDEELVRLLAAQEKERTMNDITTDKTVDLDHFVLGLDDEGNEVKIKVSPDGELVQEVEDKDEEETIH